MIFSFRSFAVLLVAGLLTLSLSACDSGGSNDTSVNNRFSLEITSTGGSAVAKSANETIEGYSFFVEGEDPQTGDQAFGLYFADEQDLSQQSAQQGLFGFVARASSRPGTGSYTVSDADGDITSGAFIMVLYKNIGTNMGTYYIANSGSFEVTTSNDDRVEASVDVQATQFSFDANNQMTTETVSITGSITAENADVFLGFSGYAQ